MVIDKETFPFLFQEIGKYVPEDAISFTFRTDEALVSDPELDDAFAIVSNAEEKRCEITGSNRRSLLFGFYTFLRKCGYEWLFPGTEGERRPKVFAQTSFRLAEKAGNRYRGIVLEGANSIDHLLALVDYLPKLCFNSYFIQFFNPYYFFRNWYEHVHNPLLQDGTVFPFVKAMEYKRELIAELKRRGLMVHDVGHGWTGKVLGIETLGWDALQGSERKSLEEKNRPLFALVHGKREFHDGIPANTQLCYSNSDVRQRIADAVAGYAAEHRDVDYLHVWLADEFNNMCECDECRKKRPSDWYVMTLNAIDAELQERNLSTKIVFLLYNDLLWPPKEERIANPSRFVMMFAPIGRSFEKNLAEGSPAPMRPYEYNRITLPSDTQENLTYLKGWQECFSGDAFDFDYHLGRAHYGDFTYHKISGILAEDIHALPGIGLSGMLMCQENRAFFPTGLPDYIAGRMLWDPKEDFEHISQTYYGMCFKEPDVAVAFFKEASLHTDMDLWNAHYPFPAERRGKRLLGLSPICDKYRLLTTDENLIAIIDYSKLFAEALGFAALGDNSHWDGIIACIRNYEKDHPDRLDCFRPLDLMKRAFHVDLGE